MLNDAPPPYPGTAKERSRIQGEIDFESLPPNYSEIGVSPNSSDEFQPENIRIKRKKEEKILYVLCLCCTFGLGLPLMCIVAFWIFFWSNLKAGMSHTIND